MLAHLTFSELTYNIHTNGTHTRVGFSSNFLQLATQKPIISFFILFMFNIII